MTSNSRTARCGPACRVVWQGPLEWRPLCRQAIALQQQTDGSFAGHTSAAYANMVGPFGGIGAAQLLNAILLHPQRLGDPVALTVNFAAAVQDGAFRIEAVPVRTNRSTQHWTLSLLQQEEVLMTGTAITAVRRETWGVDDEVMPDAPAPDEVPWSGPRAHGMDQAL